MRQGFTLLELAVVLVIVSVMAGFGIEALQAGNSADCYTVTKGQEREIQTAVDNYIRANKRLPMPAPANVGISSPLYGREVSAATDANIYNSSGVLFGALPFSTLGLNSSYSSDCWGNKFAYMVTTALTATNTYATTGTGSITVRTGTLPSVSPGPVTLTPTAAYAVVSYGADALGASARNYTGAKKNCDGGVSGTAWSDLSRVDKENCDIAATGANPSTVFSAPYNNGTNQSNFFDDVVVYANKTGFTGCNAGTVAWSPGCTSPIVALAHSGSQNVTNTATDYSGTANVSCNNGVLTTTSVSCFSTASCPSQTVSWSQGGNNCSGTAPIITHGSSAAVTNTASGFNGSVTQNCTGGVLTAAPGATCTPILNCNAQTVSWGGGCSGSASALISGNSGSVNNSASNYTGSVNIACSNGTLTQSGGVCNAVPAGCPSQSINWNTNCSGTTGALSSGGSGSVSNTASGYTGSVNISCSNGVLTPSGGSCSAVAANCNAQTVTWGNCSASAGSLTNGATASLTNSVSGYTGSATGTCTNGTISASSTVCNASCSTQTITWGTNCSADVTAMPHGNSVTPTNTASGYTGSVTATCSNGTINQAGASCSGTGGCPYAGTTQLPFTCASSGAMSPSLVGTNGNYGDCVIHEVNLDGCQANWSGNWTGGGGQNCHICTTECVADGQSSGGNASSCCNGDSDGNGVCGTQGGGTCVGGWGAEYPRFTEDSSAGANAEKNSQGYCAAGAGGQEGGNDPSTKNKVDYCVTRVASNGSDYTIFERACGGTCGATAYSCTKGNLLYPQYSDCETPDAPGKNSSSWQCAFQECGISYGSTHCFLDDVSVTLANGTKKLMSALKAGDKVRGHTRVNHVIAVPDFRSSQRIYGLNGGKKFVTGGHPFYTTKGWRAIDPSLTPSEGHKLKTTLLKIGDHLLLDTGKEEIITSIDGEESGEHHLFNPMVDGDHTYYANGLLVHNKTYPYQCVSHACVADGSSSKGTTTTNDPQRCCNGDSDGNGMCGT